MLGASAIAPQAVPVEDSFDADDADDLTQQEAFDTPKSKKKTK
jgi:hypothetical protein